MSNSESARRILEVFKQGQKFHTLREVAKRAGFETAAAKEFKRGFNYLIDEGIIILQQSGWRSEKRGGKSHPKTVLLNADLYEIVEREYNLDRGMAEITGMFSDVSKTGGHKPLSKVIIERFQSCSECIAKPSVFITSKKIPVCRKHWEKLAPSLIEWSG
jgi:hypothetical protein